MSYNQNGWEKDEDTGAWYHSSDGETTTGWNRIDGNWYYFYPGGSMTWDNTVDGFYLDSSGKMVNGTGWLQDKATGSWYYSSDGEMTTGWKQDGDNWYYLNDDGKMATGWNKIDGNWYYLYSSGEMATGWTETDNGWYYLYSDGSMTYENTVNGYHLGSSGKMVTGTGWQYVDGSWYYLKDDGKVATDWLYDQENWYYLYPQGSMAKDTTVEGYCLDKSGKWIPSKDDDSGNSQRTNNAEIADGPTLKSRMQRLPGESTEYDPDTGVNFNPYNGEIENFSESFAKLPGEGLYYKIGESKKYFDPAIYKQFAVTPSITDCRIDSEDPSSGFSGYIGGTVSGGILAGGTLSFNLYFSYNKNTDKWTISIGSSGGPGFIAGENLEAKAHIGFADGNENSLDGAAIGTEAITPLVDAQIAVTPDNHHCVEVSLGPGVGVAYQENASYTVTKKIFTFDNYFY